MAYNFINLTNLHNFKADRFSNTQPGVVANVNSSYHLVFKRVQVDFSQ